MLDVRKLSVGEHALFGDIIADSFSDDPVNLWIFGGEDAMRQYYTQAARKLYLKKGFGHVVPGGRAAALWLPPGVSKKIPLWNSVDILLSLVRRSGFTSLKRGMVVDEALVKAKPKDPHYYLFAIGARQAHQGKGLGGQLITTGLLHADKNKMPVYLENSKEANIGFYQHFGFEVIEKLVPTSGCPPLWLMWRKPKELSTSS